MCSDSIKKRQNTPLLRGEKPWKGGVGIGTRGCQAGAAMEAAVCRFFWLPGVVSVAHGSSGLKVKAVGSHHLNKGQTVTLLCRLGLYMFPENSRKPSMIIDQASLDIWLIASLELVFAVFFFLGFSDCCCLHLKPFSKVLNNECCSEVSGKCTCPFFSHPGCKQKQVRGKRKQFQEAAVSIC